MDAACFILLLLCFAFLLTQLYAQHLEGFVIHRGGAVAHQLRGVLHLRERGDVAQAVGAAEDHRDAIQSDAHAAVGRRAVLVRFHEEAENFFIKIRL